jgi:hypothetical protein
MLFCTHQSKLPPRGAVFPVKGVRSADKKNRPTFEFHVSVHECRHWLLQAASVPPAMLLGDPFQHQSTFLAYAFQVISFLYIYRHKLLNSLISAAYPVHVTLPNLVTLRVQTKLLIMHFLQSLITSPLSSNSRLSTLCHSVFPQGEREGAQPSKCIVFYI